MFSFKPRMVVLISENTHVSGVSGFDNCNYISLSFNYIPINISFTTIYKNNYSEIRTNIYASCYSNLNLNVFEYYSNYYREIDAVVFQFNSLNITYYYWAIG